MKDFVKYFVDRSSFAVLNRLQLKQKTHEQFNKLKSSQDQNSLYWYLTTYYSGNDTFSAIIKP